MPSGNRNHSDGPEEKVCLGVIVGARGLKGDLRIKSFTQVPGAITDYGTLSDETGNRAFELAITGEAKGILIGRLDGVRDRTAAEKLKGQRLFVDRDRLPPPDEDEYYHSDLIGLAVEAPQGSLGIVRDVFDFGAGDVLEVSGGDFGTVMVPFTKATVPVVDLAGGKLIIDPPDGLLDPPEEAAKGETELEQTNDN